MCSGTEYGVQKGWVRAAKTQQPIRPVRNKEPERADAPAKRLLDNDTNEQLFNLFDANQSGWLSGRELLACGCIKFDKDGNDEVTKAEVMAGMGAKDKGAKPTDDDDDDAVQPKDANGECASNAPAVDRSGTAKASETLFKGVIYYNYNLAANGTGQGPLKVGVVFLSFQVGAPFSNTVSNVPGIGAQRKNDAAPVNAAIYPVRSKHIVCEQYRDRSLRRQIESNYACFKNRDGQWVCGVDGFPKIVQLN